VSATQKLLRFGVFELNLDTAELRKSGTLVRLPPQPFKLLALLAAHAGQIVTREEIQTQLWGDETHVDFEHGVNKCIKQIRTVLADDADRPMYVETLPRQGYRFLAPVVSKTIAAPKPQVVESQSGERGRAPWLGGGSREMPAPVAGATAPSYALTAPQAEAAANSSPAATISEPRFRIRRKRLLWIAVAVMLVAAVAGGLYWRFHKKPLLAEKDTVVLTDFDNKTDDSIFDDTLKQALAIQLEQSPFLNVLSDRKVGRTLRLMNRSASDGMPEDVAREVCLRSNSKAMLSGSISTQGSGYAIDLKAIACNSGKLLAEAQTQAPGSHAVLAALDAAAVSLRGQLGESLSSVQRYSAPLVEATTPSLEALKAYSVGRKMHYAKGDNAALPFFERAVELDPNFAIAYAGLAVAYGNLNEVSRASENARIAYELRQKVSERERLVIEAFYYTFVTGELEKAVQSYEVSQQIYPRDPVPYANLGFLYGALGRWDQVLDEARGAMSLEPNSVTSYANLGNSYMVLNRLDESEAVYKEAAARKLEGKYLLGNRYELAFLKQDAAQMDELAAAAVGVPGAEDFVLASQADTEGWYGRFKHANELTVRAVDSAQRNDTKESAAAYQVAAALREAAAGDSQQALLDARKALTLAQNRDVRAMAAVAFALAGDHKAAEKIATELDKMFPLDTLVQKYWLPSIGAAIALKRNEPGRAIEKLQMAQVIELSQPTQVSVYLCPVYLRGEAYLMRHDGSSAAAEFQKFIDHRGLVVNFPWGSLAYIGLARAYALQGDVGRAHAEYDIFLRLWKNADPDLPIYKEARAEYAKLQ